MSEEKTKKQAAVEQVHNIIDSAATFIKSIFPLTYDLIDKLKKRGEDKK